jgi:chromosome segregation ATPase
LEPQAAAADLPQARERLARAKAELSAFLESKEGAQASLSEAASRKFSLLEDAVFVARQQIDDLETAQKRATKRIAEIDGVLNAASNLQTARAAWSAVGEEVRGHRARAAQLDGAIATLGAEIATLERRREEDLAAAGEAELAARLAGKATPPVPKSLATIEIDLAARRNALASAERGREAVLAAASTALERNGELRQRLRVALMRQAELDYYEQLPAFLPVAARLMAAGSWIGGGPNRGNMFCVRVDDELIVAASAQIERELGAASQPKADAGAEQAMPAEL